MQETFICLDVGGTEIKGAALQQNGTLLTALQHFPSRSNESAQALIAHFTALIVDLARQASAKKIDGLRLAFPGPFDYENGICLLQGLSKYDALYGLSLREALTKSLEAHSAVSLGDTFDIRFVNDVGAFALGELHHGHAAGSARALFVCIGTGCGSAFSVGSLLAPTGTPHVPLHGYIYDQPFLGSNIDDYLSRRGICALSKKMLGTACDGLALSKKVQDGDLAARACFDAFGDLVTQALTPFLDTFKPEYLVLGGQITRSADLFTLALRKSCTERNILLCFSDDTSLRTLQGLLSI